MKDSFLRYIEFEKRYSKHTVTSYEHDLTQFTDYLEQTYALSETERADHHQIRSWLVELAENEMVARSINRKIACLKSYFKFLKRNGYITVDPTLRIKTLKTPKRLPEVLEEKPLNFKLDHLSEDSSFNAIRERMILELLYGTGIRLSELIELKDADINIYGKTIKVLGKGNKERIIPINISLQQVIDQYRVAKNSLPDGNQSGYFIVTDNNSKSYSSFIYRIVKKNLSHVTTAEKKSPHVLRHSFATHLLNKGADLNAIKDLLGHSSLAATQVYTHNSIEKLKAIFEKAHPKA